VPGLVNPETGRVVVSSDLPSVVRADLQTELARATNLPIALVNDANAAAYGEYIAGAGAAAATCSTSPSAPGIGGALIMGGKLWYGDSGFAGEFGHITMTAKASNAPAATPAAWRPSPPLPTSFAAPTNASSATALHL
jgi:glucokinase